MERRFPRGLSACLRGSIALPGLLLCACQAPVRPSAAPTEDAAAAVAPTPPPAPLRPAPTAPVALEPAVEPVVLPQPLRGTDVFARLRQRFADPACVRDRVVQRWEHVYGRWPPRLRANLEQILPLLALVLDEVELHHLPGEFALLPIVESWYRPDAGSPRSAYGMWQFTGATARNQGLRIQPGFDERLAPQAATRAAMRYLAILMNRFGDWKLADMAFNAGEYRVQRVLRQVEPAQRRVSAAAHLPPGLSMTTYEHVAKLQALACLLARPEKFGLELPDTVLIEPLQQVEAPAALTTLDAVAERVGLAPKALKALNPAYPQGRLAGAPTRAILLPADAARLLQREPGAAATSLAATQREDPDATPREHRVARGDTLGAIAQRYGLRLAQLLQWNRLDVRALLHPGQRLRLEP